MCRVPALPPSRGPLTRWLFGCLEAGTSPIDAPFDEDVDPLVDDDFQLALYCLYELSYRGFRSVSPRMEADCGVFALRRRLASRFESALRTETAPVTAAARSVVDLLDRFDGPSLSCHMLRRGTLTEYREFLVHRSTYQLKEADPHTWVIPRLPAGRRKAALLEIQLDEYGSGVPGHSHAELFADAMDAAGLDPSYGAHLHRLPGVTLATCNLVSMFGSERRLAGALVGHLAAFEMTSVEPMSRYCTAAAELGLPDAVGTFFRVHVEADAHHGSLARDVLLGGDLRADGLDPSEVLFGVAALLRVEDRFTRHLLDSWRTHRSSFGASGATSN